MQPPQTTAALEFHGAHYNPPGTAAAHYNPLTGQHARNAAFAALLVAAATLVAAPRRRPNRTGRSTAAIRAATKYSPLTDINPSTVARLAVAWEWTPARRRSTQFGTRPGNFQATPLMIDNVLYLSTPYNRVVALDAETGARALGLRSEGLRGRPAAERHRLRASRRRRVARQRTATSCASSSTAAIA